MKNFRIFLLAIISLSFFLQSCQKEDINEPQAETETATDVQNSDVSEAIISKLGSSPKVVFKQILLLIYRGRILRFSHL